MNASYKAMFYVLIFIVVLFTLNSMAWGDSSTEAILFIRDNNVWIKDIEGKIEKQLVHDEVMDLSVSKTGKMIYNITEDKQYYGFCGLYLATIPERAEKIDIISCGSSLLSPDGSKIVYTKVNNKGYKNSYVLDLITKTEFKIPFTPFSKKLRRSGGIWDQYNDSLFSWSNDSKMLTFRRCTGDEDKPTCMVFSHNINAKKTVMINEKLAFEAPDKYLQFHNIGVVEGKIFYVWNFKLYAYDIATQRNSLIADDCACLSISPDEKYIAHISTYRTKDGANLWLIDKNGNNKKRLTNYVDYNINGCNIKWSWDSKKINVRWWVDDKPGVETYPAWRINIDGSNLSRVVIASEAETHEWRTTVPKSVLQQ